MLDKAKWIWAADVDPNGYNQTILVRKAFMAEAVLSAQLAITADSRYRVTVNGTWVNDGPCRSWPFAFQYDVLDITPYLMDGENTVEVIARYFGAGSCHLIPQQGGLLASIKLRHRDGSTEELPTDSSWLSARAAGWQVYTPKVSLGLEPSEIFDARIPMSEFKPSVETHLAEDAPWSNLHPRDVALLTRDPREIKAFMGAKYVNPAWEAATFSPVRMFFPGLMEANGFTCMAGVAATVLDCEEAGTVKLGPYPPAEGPTITINGHFGDDGVYPVKKGANLLLALFEPWGHHNKEQGIRIVTAPTHELRNPLDGKTNRPWQLARNPEHNYHEQDGELHELNPADREAMRERVEADYQVLLKEVADEESFRRILGPHCLSADDDRYQPVPNPHWQFECREVLGNAIDNVQAPTALAADNADSTVVYPAAGRDVELSYDLGDETVGYIEFEVAASEGTVIDVFMLEYIDRDGRIQHTWATRNGVRLVCKEGTNRFRSLARRAGRYVFITVRQQRDLVSIRSVKVVESTYPVIRQGRFSCSDAVLGQIWNTSLTTLKLCMEDVYTDCPLYEQTLWVGDARNEALFSMTAYGQTDIMRRCIRLAAQGLEKFPIVPSHAPTSNGECILPAWAFLWGISVWDYYFYTGEEEFLIEIWPAVIRNLKGAESLLDSHGLFSGSFWNMFDWTDIDAGHRTVLHNSMLLVGCIDAARKCAKVVGDKENEAWLTQWRTSLAGNIGKLWHDEKKAYRDSIHDDGKPSEEVSIHTSFLALLYDIAPETIQQDVLKNVLDPPEGMTRIGSPFAIQYMYEAFEKCGHEERIIESVLENYIPMLRAGATTVWEQFPNGLAFNPEGFPTRSHCHAWSSAPIHFLNRIILGIRQTEPAGAAFEISPYVALHDWADGVSASIRGPISARWEKKDGKLIIEASAPTGVRLSFKANPTHEGLKVVLNGNEIAPHTARDVELGI